MSVATSTNDLIEIALCSFGCIWVDSRHSYEIRIEHAGEHLSIECNGFLVEFLGVSNIAKSDLVEGIF